MDAITVTNAQPIIEVPFELHIKAEGVEWTVHTGKMTENTLLALVRQGLTIIAQRSTAGLDKTTPASERHSKVRKVLEAIQTNTYEFGGGGGGKRLSEIEVELRSIVEAVLVKNGWKKAEAKSLVTKNTTNAVVEYVKAGAKKQGKVLDQEALDRNVDRYLAQWTAEAEEVVAVAETRRQEAGLDEMILD